MGGEGGVEIHAEGGDAVPGGPSPPGAPPLRPGAEARCPHLLAQWKRAKGVGLLRKQRFAKVLVTPVRNVRAAPRYVGACPRRLCFHALSDRKLVPWSLHICSGRCGRPFCLVNLCYGSCRRSPHMPVPVRTAWPAPPPSFVGRRGVGGGGRCRDNSPRRGGPAACSSLPRVARARSQ